MTSTTLAGPPSEEVGASEDLIGRERAAVAELAQSAQERNTVETETEPAFAAQLRNAEREFADREQRLKARFDAATQSVQEEYAAARSTGLKRFQAETEKAEKEFAAAKEASAARFESEMEKVKKRLHEARWEAQTISESGLSVAKEKFEAFKREFKNTVERRRSISNETLKTLHGMGRHRLMVESEPAAEEAAEAEVAETTAASEDGDAATIDYPRVIQDKLAIAETELNQLRALGLPRWAKADVVCWPFVLLGLAGIYPAYLALGIPLGPIVSVAAAAVSGVVIGFMLIRLGTQKCQAVVTPLLATLAEAEALQKSYYGRENGANRRLLNENRQHLSREIKQADRQFEVRKTEAERKRNEEKAAAETKYPALVADVGRRRDDEMKRIETEYPAKLAALKKKYQEEAQKFAAEKKQKLGDLEAQRGATWKQITDRWQTSLRKAASEAAAVQATCDQLFPTWTEESVATWRPPTVFPRAVSFGESRLQLRRIPNGPPKDPRLAALGDLDLAWPSLAPFPGGSLVFKAPGPAIAQANDTLAAIMLRLLTALPPGKVRFTIFDPVGLGQNFAAFMHLADYEEALVHSRIWTESNQFDQCLADLTSHMETVIQKYLRNEFETIDAYNEQAGEVAEPYRFVVAANFPVNFSEAATKRLVSIVQSGARCGVQALISWDTKQPPPHGLNAADLESRSVQVVWTAPKDKEPRWVWKDKDFERFPLTLAKPVDPDVVTSILHLVGRKAKESNRVQVPFEMVAPPQDRWWTDDSAKGVEVALGRAGATKLQYLRLGHGTSQHVLIAGRTGSGKSTLLHILITNIALHYSPEQVELYLIDFKKGVEFKTYATAQLPHARVIAIESEREFGLSVMQRLDGELKRRGEVYRVLGVQDLAGYRKARAGRADMDPMPRILFIVDEFQEFFTEDDRVAQEATLLLDRLVRQGRAFGIHVHLGSQTLGGAYSLARTTLGQMAIRIALQCSESDAHLILSEDNSAARLLSRPGEAIYNDSNGSVEGNNPFQIVWLDDEKKDHYLGRILEMAKARNMLPKTPAIIFEGNVPADVNKNTRLLEVVASRKHPETARAHFAWLGEAIAIKDPTSADFRSQSGTNVLIIGQQVEAALGMLTTAFIGLAAQIPPEPGLIPPRITILNGMAADAPDSDLFDRLAKQVPGTKTAGLRELPAAIKAVAEEVERRLAKPDEERLPIFLLVFDLARFRALRKSEDDFSFSSRGDDKPADPAKLFTMIVRDGPAMGVHTIIWCDTLNNLNRTFERGALREFDMRVLFQMSANDSSSLIDSPAASRLGQNRALLVSEEQGKQEKFRPYGMPTQEWLEHIGDSFRAKEAPALAEPEAHVGHDDVGQEASG